RRPGQLFESSLNALRQSTQSAQPLLISGQLRECRQLAVQQEVSDLFKLTLRREVQNVVPAIVQVVAIAPHRTQRRVARRNTRKRNRLLRLEPTRSYNRLIRHLLTRLLDPGP